MLCFQAAGAAFQWDHIFRIKAQSPVNRLCERGTGWGDFPWEIAGDWVQGSVRRTPQVTLHERPRTQ